MAEKQHIEERDTSKAKAVADQRRKALQHEKYVYRGKLYSFRRLYEGSRVKLVVFTLYSFIVLGLIIGVLWYTYAAPSGALEELMLQIKDFFTGLFGR